MNMMTRKGPPNLYLTSLVKTPWLHHVRALEQTHMFSALVLSHKEWCSSSRMECNQCRHCCKWRLDTHLSVLFSQLPADCWWDGPNSQGDPMLAVVTPLLSYQWSFQILIHHFGLSLLEPPQVQWVGRLQGKLFSQLASNPEFGFAAGWHSVLLHWQPILVYSVSLNLD